MPPAIPAPSDGISIEIIILAITVAVMVYQTFETSRSIHAAGFKAANPRFGSLQRMYTLVIVEKCSGKRRLQKVRRPRLLDDQAFLPE